MLLLLSSLYDQKKKKKVVLVMMVVVRTARSVEFCEENNHSPVDDDVFEN